MDLHPTSSINPHSTMNLSSKSSGNRRPPPSNATKKDGDRAKSSKNPPPQPQPRPPKRAFGVARNPNTLLEKPKPPQPVKTAKPWKPSGSLPKPARTALPTADAVSSGKKKPEAKKTLRVGFVETPALSQTVDGQGDGTVTPVASIKPKVVDTPYLSALNCSKCRLDKLETAAYWLSQIGLAEAVGKHSVSAAFFRLALECDAQPFHRIQTELRHYVTRHAEISMEASWKDLYEAYELCNSVICTEPLNLDEIDAVLVEHDAIDAVLVDHEEIGCKDTDELGSMMLKDGSLDSNCEHLPMHNDLSSEQPPIEHVIDIDTCEATVNTTLKGSVEAKKEKFSRERKIIPKGSEKISAGSSVSGKNSNREKSKRASTVSPNVSSSDTKVRKSGGSAAKGGETSSRARSLPRRSGASPEVSQSSVTKSLNAADEKGPDGKPGSGGTEGDSKHVNMERTIQFKDL